MTTTEKIIDLKKWFEHMAEEHYDNMQFCLQNGLEDELFHKAAEKAFSIAAEILEAYLD